MIGLPYPSSGFTFGPIPIVVHPQLAPYDLILWQAQVDAIMNDRAWNNGNYTRNPARAADAEFGVLLLTTPDNYNTHMTRRQVFEELENDWSEQ